MDRKDKWRQKTSLESIFFNNVISDNAIKNCNRLFWLKNEHEETARIWNIEKELGFTYMSDDEGVVKSIQAMEISFVRKESFSKGG